MLDQSELILRDMSDGVIVVTREGRLSTINPAARQLLELGEGEPQGSFADLFIGDSRNDGFVQAILDALGAKVTPAFAKTDFYTHGGCRRIIEVSSTFKKGGGEGEGNELIAVLKDVTERERSLVYHKDVTILISVVFIVFSLFIFAFKFFDTVKPGVVAPSTMTAVLLVSMLAVFALISKKVSIKPRINVSGGSPGRAIMMGALVALAAVAAMAVIKLVMLRMGAGSFKEGQPFFDFSRFSFKEIYWYLPSVLIQEFITRSVMQESFIYVFGENYGWLAILVSSLIFGAMHIFYSFTLMAGAALLLGGLGMFYQKNRNLIAVSIVHYVAAEAGILLGLLGN